MNDHELTRRFEDGSFPFEEWDHRAHLKVAYLYLVRHPFAEAVSRMRQGLWRLIRENRIPETQGSGYHETITCAWMQLVDAALREHGPARDAEHFLRKHPQLCNKRILRLFYSHDRLLSRRAKREFVDPDLAPLPQRRKPAAGLSSGTLDEVEIDSPLVQGKHWPC